MKKITINGIAQILKLGAERGISQAELLRGSGIKPEILKDPYASIEPTQEFQVLRTLLSHVKDDTFGLIAGEHFRLSILGILGAAVPNAATVKDAIQFFIRFINLSYTYFEVTYEQTQQGAIIRLKDKIELAQLRRFFIDRDTMFTLTAFKDLFPQPHSLNGLKLKLGYEQPKEVAFYINKFNCPIEFSEGDTLIYLDQKILAQTLQQSNELTLKLMEQQCLDVDAKLTGKVSVVEKVTQILLSNLAQTAPLEHISKQLGLTSRTIRRHLQKEGIQFQKLLNNLRCEEAKRLLNETSWSVENIAIALGYSEPGSFIHAFKAWMDCTPTEFRKSNS